MPKIAIIGAGAIGSVVAALLETTGQHEVVLCVRRPLPELTVEDEFGGASVRVVGRRLADPAEATPVDWIMVATKAYDVAAIAPWLAPLGGGSAPLAVLQNGVEHRERFDGFYPAERIVPVVVNCPVERLDPARVRQRGRMLLTAPDTGLGRAFAALFAGSSADVSAVPDFLTAVWRKLALNSAAIVPALVGRPAGVLRDESVGAAAREIVRECVAVGRAEGARLPDTLADEVLANYRAQPPDSVNSLLADRLARRPMEIEARNGVIVRLGRKHGLPTPCNQLAVALLSALS